MSLPDTPDRYYYFVDKDGDLNKADLVTGEVVQRAPKYEESLVGGNILDPAFLDGHSRRFYRYTPIYKDVITGFMAQGLTLSEVCRMPGMPSMHIITRWRSENEEFNKAILQARKSRAEIYADRVDEELATMDNLKKDEVPAKKLKVDTLKWLAEKNDPDSYGNKIKHTGDAENPITLVVDTGIRVDTTPKETAIEADYKEIDDE